MSTKKQDKNKLKLKTLKKEVKFIDCTIIGLFVFLFAFVCVILAIFASTGTEPSSLIVSVFAFCGLEAGLLASLTKRKKAINQEKENTEKLIEAEKQIQQQQADGAVEAINVQQQTVAPIEQAVPINPNNSTVTAGSYVVNNNYINDPYGIYPYNTGCGCNDDNDDYVTYLTPIIFPK